MFPQLISQIEKSKSLTRKKDSKLADLLQSLICLQQNYLSQTQHGNIKENKKET